MPLLEQHEARDLLGEHVQGLRLAILAAWADYRDPTNYSAEARALHCSTTRANCVHDHMKERVSEYAQRHGNDLQVCVVNRMFVLAIKGSIGIRFKKLDNELQTANHQTGQVLAFKRQEEIPLIAAHRHLEIGYRLDVTEQQILGVFLLCPNGEFSNYWVWELNERQSVPIVEDFFEAKQSRAEQPVEDAVVRPKKSGDVIPLKREADDDADKR